MTRKRKIIAILIAWMIFIGVDFLFHASILESLWQEEISAFKPLENLALLIPVGYASFLLLTILVAYLFLRIYPDKPSIEETAVYGLIFGLLFSLSNLLGLYSYVEIPWKYLVLFNLVYGIEIVVVALTVRFIAFSSTLRKSIGRSILLFLALILSGIVIQNVFRAGA